MLKKCLALALVLATLSLGAFAELPEYINTESALPIVKDGFEVTLDIAANQGGGWGDAKDIWFWKYVENAMNIKVNVTQSQDMATYKSLVFASGDLPDMFVGSGFSSAELVQYGDLEGQIIDLMPYVREEYMPNLCAMLKEMPDMLASITTTDGKLYSLPNIEDAESNASCCHNSGARFFINTDRLSETGKETPQTLDEFIDVLRALKASDESIVPLGGAAQAYNPGTLMLISLGYLTGDAWGLTPCLRDGKVVIPAGDREVFGEYLTLMNQLWTEGLIEQDFFTLDAAACDARMAQNQYGVFGQVAYLTLPDTFANWWHISPLTSAWNETKQWPSNSINLDSKAMVISTGGIVITSACEDIATALRFADWFYDPVNFTVSVYGPSYLMVEQDDMGYGITKGWNVDPETMGRIYLDLQDVTQSYQYTYENIFAIHAGAGWGNALYYLQEPAVMVGLFDDVSQVVRVFDPANGDDHYRISEKEMCRDYLKQMYPKYTFFSPEEVAEINDYRVLIESYVKEETAKFVTGLRPLTELDAYFDALETMGMNEWLGYYADYYAALNG